GVPCSRWRVWIYRFDNRSIATRHSLVAVLPLVVFQILPRANVVHPVRVVDVPGHRRAQPLLEGDRGPPAEFGLDLAAVDGVAAVVPGPGRHVTDQGARLAADVQQGVGQVEVGAVAEAA